MFSKRRTTHKGFLLFTGIAVLLTALVGYLLMHRLQTHSLQSLQHSIDTWRLTLTALRWTAIAIITLSWNHLVMWRVHSRTTSHNKATLVLEWRRRVITWLVLLELVVGQGVLVKATYLWIGAGQ